MSAQSGPLRLTAAGERLPAHALPGWSHDDHREGLAAFRTSIDVLRAAVCDASVDPGLSVTWLAALERLSGQMGSVGGTCEAARLLAQIFDFVESHPLPHGEIAAESSIAFTGFFEPVVRASWTRSPEFSAPLYGRPADLVALADDRLRGAQGDRLTYARAGPSGLEPFFARAEIAAGALDGRGLELAYVADEVDAFLLQVQGSGLLQFADGSARRVSYDGKNGWPYVSIGKWLIAHGHIATSDMTMDGMLAWLRAATPKQRRSILDLNPSFVFFTVLPVGEAAAKGAAGVDLIAGRSLAVDASIFPLGALLFVAPHHGADVTPRVMVAHDVGSAIRGPCRGDIYFGTGDAAGLAAGRVRHGGRLFFAVPRDVPPLPGPERL